MVIDIAARRIGSSVLLELGGELDLSTCLDVEAELKSIEQSRPDLILVDLRGVRFMDSTGLRLLLAADQRASVDQRRLAIIPGPPTVQRLFEMTRLDTRLDFVRDAASVGL